MEQKQKVAPIHSDAVCDNPADSLALTIALRFERQGCHCPVNRHDLKPYRFNGLSPDLLIYEAPRTGGALLALGKIIPDRQTGTLRAALRDYLAAARALRVSLFIFVERTFFPRMKTLVGKTHPVPKVFWFEAAPDGGWNLDPALACASS